MLQIEILKTTNGDAMILRFRTIVFHIFSIHQLCSNRGLVALNPSLELDFRVHLNITNLQASPPIVSQASAGNTLDTKVLAR